MCVCVCVCVCERESVCVYERVRKPTNASQAVVVLKAKIRCEMRGDKYTYIFI